MEKDCFQKGIEYGNKIVSFLDNLTVPLVQTWGNEYYSTIKTGEVIKALGFNPLNDGLITVLDNFVKETYTRIDDLRFDPDEEKKYLKAIHGGMDSIFNKSGINRLSFVEDEADFNLTKIRIWKKDIHNVKRTAEIYLSTKELYQNGIAELNKAANKFGKLMNLIYNNSKVELKIIDEDKKKFGTKFPTRLVKETFPLIAFSREEDDRDSTLFLMGDYWYNDLVDPIQMRVMLWYVAFFDIYGIKTLWYNGRRRTAILSVEFEE